MGKGKRVRRTVNYGDAERGGADGDGSWQENMSDYNSDFSMPSDDEQGNNISLFQASVSRLLASNLLTNTWTGLLSKIILFQSTFCR